LTSTVAIITIHTDGTVSDVVAAVAVVDVIAVTVDSAVDSDVPHACDMHIGGECEFFRGMMASNICRIEIANRTAAAVGAGTPVWYFTTWYFTLEGSSNS